jgi:hypothetical protein
LLLAASAIGCGTSNGDAPPSGAGGSGGTASAGGTPSAGGTASTPNIYVSSIRLGAPPNCLPRPLSVDAMGALTDQCLIAEAVVPASGACACDEAHGRRTLDATHPAVPDAIAAFMAEELGCNSEGMPPCSAFCVCEIAYFTGAELKLCETSLEDPGTEYGVCYVDASLDLDGDGTPDDNPELVASCPASEKRMLRFMGAGVPASGAELFFSCGG